MDLYNIILEDGYHSDYIYSVLISLFYSQCDGLNKLINTDTDNSNTYYLQEYIKRKFIYQLHKNLSIEACIVNKLRIFLYNCGWLRDEKKNLLDHCNVCDFYDFIICDMMDYHIKIIKNNPESNNIIINYFHITDKHISENNNNVDVINLTTMLSNWMKSNVEEKYTFKSLPELIPIYLDIRDNTTKLNRKCVNIMEGIRFDDNQNKLQRSVIWEFHSMICQDANFNYYSVVPDNNAYTYIGFSDKKIPSNWIINLKNENDVIKIMREVRMVFYKLH